MTTSEGSLSSPTRLLASHEFWCVGSLQIRRTAEGLLDEYTHKIAPGIRPNSYASGPFCFLGLTAAPRAAGLTRSSSAVI